MHRFNKPGCQPIRNEGVYQTVLLIPVGLLLVLSSVVSGYLLERGSLLVLRSEQIAEIRGYADRHMLITSDPSDSRNRRISVIMKYEGP